MGDRPDEPPTLPYASLVGKPMRRPMPVPVEVSATLLLLLSIVWVVVGIAEWVAGTHMCPGFGARSNTIRHGTAATLMGVVVSYARVRVLTHGRTWRWEMRRRLTRAGRRR